MALHETGAPDTADVEVIDLSEYHPRRIPSKKWRELIKKVWEVDPLICPHCGAEMKLIALIDDDEVIEKILRYLDMWPEQTDPACLSRAPPSALPPEGGERSSGWAYPGRPVIGGPFLRPFEQPADICADEIERRHQHQRKRCGEHNAVAQGKRHGTHI